MSTPGATARTAAAASLTAAGGSFTNGRTSAPARAASTVIALAPGKPLRVQATTTSRPAASTRHRAAVAMPEA